MWHKKTPKVVLLLGGVRCIIDYSDLNVFMQLQHCLWVKPCAALQRKPAQGDPAVCMRDNPFPGTHRMYEEVRNQDSPRNLQLDELRAD